jgi:hypothetical protein
VCQIEEGDNPPIYLLSNIEEDVYMEIPVGYDITEEARALGFDPNDPDLVLKLNKALYGTPQAGRMWNKDINKYLIFLGFKPFVKDPCTYMKRDQNGDLVIISLYVMTRYYVQNPRFF